MSRATSAALEESLWKTAEKSREPKKFQVSRGPAPSSGKPARRSGSFALPPQTCPVQSLSVCVVAPVTQKSSRCKPPVTDAR
jgi:hypothetical protein